MNKATKFFVVLLALGVAVVCVGMGYTAVKNNEDTTTTTVATVNPTNKVTTTEMTTTEPTTEKVPELSELLLGKWSDSAEVSGFEFFADGKVSFTYANLSALGLNFDGKLDNGTYTLVDNKLTILYSIYSATIDKTYEISIEDDVLTMTNDDGRVSSYVKTESFDDLLIIQGTSTPDELIGSWENTGLGKTYKFADNGKVTITVYNEKYEGVYVTEGTNVTIQYTAATKKHTEKYSFAVTKTNLALTDSDGSTFNYSRMGTGVNPSSDSGSLLGVWRDSANLSGYEFKAGEVVSVTFVNFNIPVVDVPVNGTFTGGYEVENNVLKLTYYIYGKKISNSYTFEVSGNTLKLTDTETGKVSTYVKQ